MYFRHKPKDDSHPPNRELVAEAAAQALLDGAAAEVLGGRELEGAALALLLVVHQRPHLAVHVAQAAARAPAHPPRAPPPPTPAPPAPAAPSAHIALMRAPLRRCFDNRLCRTVLGTLTSIPMGRTVQLVVRGAIYLWPTKSY